MVQNNTTGYLTVLTNAAFISKHIFEKKNYFLSVSWRENWSLTKKLSNWLNTTSKPNWKKNLWPYILRIYCSIFPRLVSCCSLCSKWTLNLYLLNWRRVFMWHYKIYHGIYGGPCGFCLTCIGRCYAKKLTETYIFLIERQTNDSLKTKVTELTSPQPWHSSSRCVGYLVTLWQVRKISCYTLVTPPRKDPLHFGTFSRISLQISRS